MGRRRSLIAAAAAAALVGAGPAAAARCSNGVALGLLAPLGGATSSIGVDQLHWAQFFVDRWNRVRGHVRISLVDGDTQLDPKRAAAVARRFVANPAILGVLGPASSNEAEAVAGPFRQAGLVFVSGSATRTSLTRGAYAGTFFRVVANDAEQAPTDARFMLRSLGVGPGDTVLVVDDGDAYSVGLAGSFAKLLAQAHVRVDRESVSKTATDFTGVIARTPAAAKAAFLPLPAPQAELFAKQLKAAGRAAIPFGTDRTFDPSAFDVDGGYVSVFAPDVAAIPANRAITAAFARAFPNGASSLAAPAYVAAEVLAAAVTRACGDNVITRAELRADVARVRLATSLIGPIRFTRNGDVVNGRFHVYKIVAGAYVGVA